MGHFPLTSLCYEFNYNNLRTAKNSHSTRQVCAYFGNNQSGIFTNPFVVGRSGNPATCASLFRCLLAGIPVIDRHVTREQQARKRADIIANIATLQRLHRMMCRPVFGKECVAGILMEFAESYHPTHHPRRAAGRS